MSVPSKQNPKVAANIAGLGPLNHTILGISLRMVNQQIGRPQSKNKSTNTAKHRQREAFREKLAHDPPTAATERETNRNFFAPRCAARKQHVGEVKTCDQKHHDCHPEQQWRDDSYRAV